ncbi:MAG TPA: cytochrome c oxidase subunit II [Candidatus Kapabacteria bacterium]|nr:cytochrome c oxidase subunit II [Candidatus Kapabacteria bacterium]
MISGIKRGIGRCVGALLLALPTALLAQDVKPRYPNHHWYSWWMNALPDKSSTYAPDIDSLFNVILWITLVVFVLVEVCLVYFLWKYRQKPGRKATYYHGNNKLEITWTALPAIILVFLAIFSNAIWSEVKSPDRFPKGAPVIQIRPRQFEWDITYPGPDGKFNTADDINTINQLYLAVNEPVQIKLEGQDVIHSFFVPEFRIKQDAVPGMPTAVWIQPTEVRDLEIACAELCGLGHYRMKGFVHVVTRDSLNHWLASQAAPPPAPAAPASDSASTVASK